MPSNEVWIAEGTPASTSTPVATVERPSVDKFTTTTADPGTGGTTLAVTANSKFPATNGYRVRVIGTSGVAEIMLVTAGAGSNSWTVTRGQDGTTGVAHSVGATVSLVEAVQRVEPQDASRVITYRGRASTFRTPGRAGTTGQKIMALHNATSSTVLVDLQKITVDMVQTVVKAVTVLPPIIRAWKFTAVPTNGTSLTKVPEDSALSSNSAVTVFGDASADGTGSGTTLTVTLPAATIITQEYAPRFMGGAGTNPQSELMDRAEFFVGAHEYVTLRALEGVCVFVDYTLATQNPTTDMWIASMRWEEYRVA